MSYKVSDFIAISIIPALSYICCQANDNLLTLNNSTNCKKCCCNSAA